MTQTARGEERTPVPRRKERRKEEGLSININWSFILSLGLWRVWGKPGVVVAQQGKGVALRR